MSIHDFDKTGVSNARPLHLFLERYEAAYRAKLDSFVGCLMGEAVNLPTKDDGLQASMFVEAALLALQQRRNVSLSELGLGISI
jgi:myo-inositol 2-dehydrogenase/D-chiro-inositol 1-dehydrogenase